MRAGYVVSFFYGILVGIIVCLLYQIGISAANKKADDRAYEIQRSLMR